jgi:twinkle protein
MANFADFGINVPSHKTGGVLKIKCPRCGNLPKHHGRKDLSVNISEGVWKCWSASCGWTGTINEKKTIKKDYVRPVWVNNTEIEDNAVKFFESRGISQFTLRQLKITTGIDYMSQFNKEVITIHFNYFINSELINVKYRGPLKSFKLHKDSMLCFYNLDSIKDVKECYIVEGEMDALSLFECGIHNVLSVPNGAGNGTLNMDYIDNSIEYLEHIEKFYIATDTDVPGINLRNELIRRLGDDKCYIIEFENKKDANEFLCAKKENSEYELISGGKDQLIEALKNSKEIKIEGIFLTEDVFSEMLTTYRNGKNRGTSTYIKSIDEHWTWRKKEVTLFSGYMNEGKSNFVNQLSILKAAVENWKFAVYSPENYPIGDFYDDIIHCYKGVGVDRYFANNLLSEDEYIQGCNFTNEHFFIINPEEDSTIDNIINKTIFLIKRKGIDALVIDPYNQIEHLIERGQREDLYISKFMSQLKKVAVRYDIAIILIAHQITPIFAKNEDYPQPDPYKIKGGGTFADKADNVICVWRPFRRSNPADKLVKIIVSKVKKQRLVGIPGETELFYSRKKNQYFDNSMDCDCDGLSNIEILQRQEQTEQSQINFYEVEKTFEGEITPF